MSNQYYGGNVSFKYEGKDYEATVSAYATYSFRKGCMYLSNGDPGYPDEDDFEIDDIDVEVVFNDEGDEVPYVEDMYGNIEEALNNVNWEQDEDYEPPEPDYEPPEYDEAYTKACLDEDIG